MEVRRARILEDGSAFFGTETSSELKGRKEKNISEWTDQDWETMRRLGDKLKQVTGGGKDDDIEYMIVTPQKKDFESQIQYRKKGSKEWNSFIIRNRNEAQLTNLEPDTEYEIRVRNRFIEDDGTSGPWESWEELDPLKTQPTKKLLDA